MAKKVFIGVGHGGSDPGAVAGTFKEKNLNLSIALACQAELVRHGVNVGMSRTKDENDTLAQEVAECNAFGPDLAVDIHNNAGGGDGAEAFYSITGTGKALAENILAQIAAVGQNSRGAKTRKNSAGTDDYYGFIRSTTAPAVIVECAFVDNATDMQIIDTTAEQQAMGVAIAKGILKTLGIAWKEQKSTLYRVQIGAFGKKANAEARLAKAKSAGFKDAFIVTANVYYRVQVGAYSVKANAEAMLKKAKAAGFTDAFICEG